jgi:hypothetical protein
VNKRNPERDVKFLRREFPEAPAWVVQRLRGGSLTLTEARRLMRARRRLWPATLAFNGISPVDGGGEA